MKEDMTKTTIVIAICLFVFSPIVVNLFFLYSYWIRYTLLAGLYR